VHCRLLSFVSIFVVLLLSACTPGGSSTSEPSARIVSAAPPPGSCLLPEAHAPALVLAGVAQLQRDYARSDWGSIQREVSGKGVASSLLDQMQQWKVEGVSGLRTGLVFSQSTGKGQYVGTVEFCDDPRATPAFATFVFQLRGSAAQIVGTATGLRGATLEGASWRITRSRHFVIYHSPYQVTGSDARFVADLEYQRAQFILKFGVSVPSQIAYYLFPAQDMMKQLTRGVCGSRPENVGCAGPFAHPPLILATIWPTYHEPIHVYERALEPSVRPGAIDVYVAPLFIGEGTAVALEDREVDPRLSDYCSDLRYAPLDTCARTAIPHVQPLSLLSDAGFQRADPGYAYSLGGSFVRYLIVRFGYRTFGRFYYALAARPRDTISDYDAASRPTYHETIRQLVQQWRTDLCRPGC